MATTWIQPNKEAVGVDPMIAGWAPDPTLTSLVPNTAVEGVEVTVQVNGTNFRPYSVVEVDSTDMDTDFVSATRLSVTFTPATVGTHDVIVTNDPDAGPGHEASSPLTFTVTAAGEDETEAE